MILLHVVVAALYALTAWALWPGSVATSGAPDARGQRPPAAWASWLLPAALILHGYLAWRGIATPEGVDLSFAIAVSLVGGLVAAVAWLSGLLGTLPVTGTVVLPIAAAASLLPAFWTSQHRLAYGGEALAAAHVTVALISYAMFLVAALPAVALLGLEKRLRRGSPDPASAALPPLLTLERFLFRLVAVGFALLTLTLLSGMLFSEEVFGRPLTFTHKSVFSVLGWLTFGGLLWARWRYGVRGRTALRWIIVGTVFVFLAYLVPKFVIEGLLGR